MYIIHEGEILLKEKYGSTSTQRFYVKPPEQNNTVVLDDSNKHNVVGWFTKIFLPQGYPDSVSKDYTSYQIWDTAQAFCSTISGILATQEVLRGVGVGDTSATPLAATVTWVIKDGCGHLGRIIFAYSHGTDLDAYSKKWRLCADTLNDAALCIEMALPLFKNYTLFALCVSTIMKAIVGVAGGATRVAMTQHHAVRGNLADVAAKDSAQETAVNLIASLFAIMTISLFGTSLTIFSLMIVLHIIFNYFAVRAVCLKTLNDTRFLEVIDLYLKQEIIAAPCEINKKEPVVIFGVKSDVRIAGFEIKMGYSVKDMIKYHPKALHLQTIKDIYEDRGYILYPNIKHRVMYALIKDNAITADYLCAYFHAALLSMITCAINDINLNVFNSRTESNKKRPFAEVCQALQAADWSRTVTDKIGFSGFTYEPSYDLMKYVDEISIKEWRRVVSGLHQTGWDLSKHLLLVDEWRVYSHTLQTNRKSDLQNLGSVVQSTTKFITVNRSFVDELKPSDNHQDDRDTFTIEPDLRTSKEISATSLNTTNLRGDDQSKTDDVMKNVIGEERNADELKDVRERKNVGDNLINEDKKDGKRVRDDNQQDNTITKRL